MNETRMAATLTLALTVALAACSAPEAGGDGKVADVGGGDSGGGLEDDADVFDLDGHGGDDGDGDGGDGGDGQGGDGQGGDGHDAAATDGDAVATDAGDAGGADADAGSVDAGAADTGPADAGAADTGPADAGAADAGDTAATDAGSADAGPADAGSADAGDTGAADAGVDAGPPCTCATDADCAGASPAGGCQVALCKACQCQLVPLKDGASCDDGDPCTDKDVCKAASCVGGPSSCVVKLPAWQGPSPCKLPGKAPSPGQIKLVPAFPKLKFNLPMELTTPGDGTDRVAVVERAGRVRLFDNDDNAATTILLADVEAKVDGKGEGGLLSVAFHPKFKSNGHFYINYTRKPDFHTVVARLTQPPAGGQAPAGSELLLLDIEQPYSNHNGGQLAFDNAGMLLIGMGDGGSGGDPLNAGQDGLSLLGAMLRIDVDKPGGGVNYGIPADNPKGKGWLPEIWAIGLRNPWRFSVDKLTGAVWVADVGQNKWEEVDIVVGGGNYGWRVMEGNHCYNPANCDPKPYVPPVFEYGHNLGKSITGGHVYRGKTQNSLAGAYLFADYGSGRFWALTPDGKGGYASVDLGVQPSKPVDIGQDEQGELYAVQLFGSSTIHRIVEDTAGAGGGGLPATLSATGCFKDLGTLAPAAGVQPYEVNAPLWSDGADKARFVVLPDSGQTPPAPLPLTLPTGDHDVAAAPVGALFIKHFALGPGEIGTGQSVHVETRFMRRDADGWTFATYRWRSDGSDADLVTTGSDTSWALPGGGAQVWPQPSVDACASCHQGPAGADLLGVSAAQLNRDAAFEGGKVGNQLDVFAASGALVGLGAAASTHVKFPSQALLPKTSDPLSLSVHARTYLHVQCASCHRPGGSAQTQIDLRATASFGAGALCNVAPAFGDVGVAGAKLLVPGAPAQSVLWLRAAAQPGAADFMPKLGVTKAHAAGVLLLEAWLAGLTACP